MKKNMDNFLKLIKEKSWKSCYQGKFCDISFSKGKSTLDFWERNQRGNDNRRYEEIPYTKTIEELDVEQDILSVLRGF